MTLEERRDWKWKDMFRAGGMAFSLTRLAVGLLGFIVFMIIDHVLGAAMAVASPAVARIYLCIDLAAAAVIFMITASAIAYGVKSELLEGDGVELKGSFSFVGRNLATIILTPITFCIYIAVMLVIAWVGLLIAKIPGGVGPLLFSIGYVMYFVLMLLSGLGVLALAFSFFLAPPIIATREEGAMDAALDSVDLMRGKGAFWVALLSAAVVAVVGAFLIGVIQAGYSMAGVFMKGQFGDLVAAMWGWLKPSPDGLLAPAAVLWPAVGGGGASPSGLDYGAGFIFGVMTLVISGTVVSYLLGLFVSAGTICYLVVRDELEFYLPPEEEVTPEVEKEEKEKEEKEKEGKEKKGKEKKEAAAETAEEKPEEKEKAAKPRRRKSTKRKRKAKRPKKEEEESPGG